MRAEGERRHRRRTVQTRAPDPDAREFLTHIVGLAAEIALLAGYCGRPALAYLAEMTRAEAERGLAETVVRAASED